MMYNNGDGNTITHYYKKEVKAKAKKNKSKMRTNNKEKK